MTNPSDGWTIGHEICRGRAPWIRDNTPKGPTMTPDELEQARVTLGKLWGLGRPLHYHELAHVLRLRGHVLTAYRKGTQPIPRHVAMLVWMMLDGARPRGLERTLGL